MSAQLRSPPGSPPTRELCYVKVHLFSAASPHVFGCCLVFFMGVSVNLLLLFRLAGFKRPVVIFGPISDAVNEKLANDLPSEFVVASKCHHHFYLLACVRSCISKNGFLNINISYLTFSSETEPKGTSFNCLLAIQFTIM